MTSRARRGPSYRVRLRGTACGGPARLAWHMCSSALSDAQHPSSSPGLVPCPGLVGFHPHGRLSRVHAQHNPAHPLPNASHTQPPVACAYQHSATPNPCCARQPTDRRAQHPRSVRVQPPTSSPLRPPHATNLLPTSPAAISSHTQHPALGSSDAANTSGSVRGSSSLGGGEVRF